MNQIPFLPLQPDTILFVALTVVLHMESVPLLFPLLFVWHCSSALSTLMDLFFSGHYLYVPVP